MEFTFEITDVSIDVLGDVFDGGGLNFGTHEFGFGAKDGALVFEFGELEIKSAGPSQAGSEAFVDGFDLARETIGSDNNLFVELVEIIEDIKEFFLGFFFVFDKLDVVDNETIEVLEFAVKIFTFTRTDEVNKFGIEVGDGGVEDFEVGMETEKLIADSLDEVSFAETGAAVEEKRVLAFAGGVDNASCGSNGNVVITTDDEIIKGIFTIKAVNGRFFGKGMRER